MNQVEESALSNEPDDSIDVVVRPDAKGHSSSLLDKLLHLPRTDKVRGFLTVPFTLATTFDSHIRHLMTVFYKFCFVIMCIISTRYYLYV